MPLWSSAILFSLAANLDNIVIGLAYGTKQIRVSTAVRLFIALITGIGTIASLALGGWLAGLFPPKLAAHLGSGVLVFLGTYFIVRSGLQTHRERLLAAKGMEEMELYAKRSDRDNSGDINGREAFAVGLSLTLNNFGAGIAASAAGASLFLTTIVTFVFSFLLLTLGLFLGAHVLGRFLGRYAPFVSGLLLTVQGLIWLIV